MMIDFEARFDFGITDSGELIIDNFFKVLIISYELSVISYCGR